jgi:hypothetical protein
MSFLFYFATGVKRKSGVRKEEEEPCEEGRGGEMQGVSESRKRCSPGVKREKERRGGEWRMERRERKNKEGTKPKKNWKKHFTSIPFLPNVLVFFLFFYFFFYFFGRNEMNTKPKKKVLWIRIKNLGLRIALLK